MKDEAVDAAAVRAALLVWYDREARDLPWRRTRDPWAIWVAEVMLQQTRVETVRPYYRRFLERFPTVESLASAPLDDALALWSGLGYYRRARLLHQGARHVAEVHGGRVPGDEGALANIPGVGPYTVGAIGSQAFGLELPAVDGNVARVLARFCGVEDDVRRGPGLGRVRRVAQALSRGPRPGALVNALMEFGAVVCTPRGPRCEGCPLERACVARRLGREHELPVRTEKKTRPRVVQAAAILRVLRAREDRLVLVRCAEGGLFSGLWEPPRVAARDRHAARASLEAMLGEDVRLDETPVRRVRHVLTHRELDVTVWSGVVAGAPRGVGAKHRDRYDAVELVARAALSERGVSTLARRVLGEVRAVRGGGSR